MAGSVALDHTDLAKRRRRARISQLELARALNISPSKVSEFEKHGQPLPWELTDEDYLAAIQQVLREREGK